MLKIFAKRGTSEKVLTVCSQEQVREIQHLLNAKCGGSWVWIEKLSSSSEMLFFNDGKVYEGFDGRNSRYVQGIKQLRGDGK